MLLTRNVFQLQMKKAIYQIPPNLMWVSSGRMGLGLGAQQRFWRSCDQVFPCKTSTKGCRVAQVDTWVRWAFQTHMDKAVMQEFVSTMQTARGIPDFHDGLPIASICAGWGTCEMVIDSINSFLSDHFPSCPQATVIKVKICFLCFLCFVSSFPSMGSTMFAMIMFDFVFNLYSAQFTISFMCEKEPWKANYLQKAHPGVKVLFRDMKDLAHKTAYDVISGAKVPIPPATGLVPVHMLMPLVLILLLSLVASRP